MTSALRKWRICGETMQNYQKFRLMLTSSARNDNFIFLIKLKNRNRMWPLSLFLLGDLLNSVFMSSSLKFDCLSVRFYKRLLSKYLRLIGLRANLWSAVDYFCLSSAARRSQEPHQQLGHAHQHHQHTHQTRQLRPPWPVHPAPSPRALHAQVIVQL